MNSTTPDSSSHSDTSGQAPDASGTPALGDSQLDGVAGGSGVTVTRVPGDGDGDGDQAPFAPPGRTPVRIF